MTYNEAAPVFVLDARQVEQLDAVVLRDLLCSISIDVVQAK
jgi:hypothetical protein